MKNLFYLDPNHNPFTVYKNFKLQLMDPGRNGVIIHHVRWPVEQGQNQEQGLAPRHPLREVGGIAMVSSQKPQPVLHVHARVTITNVNYDTETFTNL